MKLLLIEEAAEFLRLSPAAVRRMVKDGTIPHRRIGPKVCFTEEDLDIYVKAAEVPMKHIDQEKGVSKMEKFINGKDVKCLCQLCVHGEGVKCHHPSADSTLVISSGKCHSFIPGDAIAALSEKAKGINNGSIQLNLYVVDGKVDGFSTERADTQEADKGPA